jgi:hypothetical protein
MNTVNILVAILVILLASAGATCYIGITTEDEMLYDKFSKITFVLLIASGLYLLFLICLAALCLSPP